MNKSDDVKVMLKEAGILLGITLLSGMLLGFFYELTREPRRLQQEKAVREACMAVFPEEKYAAAGIEFVECEYTPDDELAAELTQNGVIIGKTYHAKAQKGELFGCVVEVTASEGYGGDIVLYVGVRSDGAVNGVSVLEISETPGLGMEAPNVLVPQFAGKKVDSFVYTKTGAKPDSNEVDAIASATVTTKAVTNAVNGGLKAGLELLGAMGGANNE